MRLAGKLLSLSVFQFEVGNVGNESHPDALKDGIDIARLPSSQATLPTWQHGNLAMSQ
jgi:hypothetical protein